MLKKIVLGLGVLVVIGVGVIVTRPATYHVERSITVAATPAVVFPWVGDLHRFGDWSPWSELDPEMKTTYEGPEVGVGSVYRWEGNDQVGKGSMTVTAYVEGERMETDLEFLEPFASKAKTGLLLTADGDRTKVTWSMDGDNDFIGKAMSLFMSMDEMIGADYEKGLAKLGSLISAATKEAEATAKAAAEATAKEEAAAAQPEEAGESDPPEAD